MTKQKSVVITVEELKEEDANYGDRVTIERAEHGIGNPYFMMLRNTAQDLDVRYDELGVLTYLLSKPIDWRVKISDLMNRKGVRGEKTGRDVIYRMLRALIEQGYATRERLISNAGTSMGVRYRLFEEAIDIESQTPLPVKPETVKPLPAKGTLHNIEEEQRIEQETKQTLPPGDTGGVVEILNDNPASAYLDPAKSYTITYETDFIAPLPPLKYGWLLKEGSTTVHIANLINDKDMTMCGRAKEEMDDYPEAYDFDFAVKLCGSCSKSMAALERYVPPVDEMNAEMFQAVLDITNITQASFVGRMVSFFRGRHKPDSSGYDKWQFTERPVLPTELYAFDLWYQDRDWEVPEKPETWRERMDFFRAQMNYHEYIARAANIGTAAVPIESVDKPVEETPGKEPEQEDDILKELRELGESFVTKDK